MVVNERAILVSSASVERDWPLGLAMSRYFRSSVIPTYHKLQTAALLRNLDLLRDDLVT